MDCPKLCLCFGGGGFGCGGVVGVWGWGLGGGWLVLFGWWGLWGGGGGGVLWGGGLGFGGFCLVWVGKKKEDARSHCMAGLPMEYHYRFIQSNNKRRT